MVTSVIYILHDSILASLLVTLMRSTRKLLSVLSQESVRNLQLSRYTPRNRGLQTKRKSCVSDLYHRVGISLRWVTVDFGADINNELLLYILYFFIGS